MWHRPLVEASRQCHCSSRHQQRDSAICGCCMNYNVACTLWPDVTLFFFFYPILGLTRSTLHLIEDIDCNHHQRSKHSCSSHIYRQLYACASNGTDLLSIGMATGNLQTWSVEEKHPAIGATWSLTKAPYLSIKTDRDILGCRKGTLAMWEAQVRPEEIILSTETGVEITYGLSVVLLKVTIDSPWFIDTAFVQIYMSKGKVTSNIYTVIEQDKLSMILHNGYVLIVPVHPNQAAVITFLPSRSMYLAGRMLFYEYVEKFFQYGQEH